MTTPWFAVATGSRRTAVTGPSPRRRQIITWTLERSGPLASGGGWYYQSVKDATSSDGATFEMLDVLATKVGIAGIFSDWPATVTYYANCMGLD